tara:strand:- start:29 stop:496 length:468 start_codon:yes stop_codon:yes gene_type:complete
MQTKKFILLALLVSFTFHLKAQDMDKIASCAGVVVGNASVDYILGDKQAFNDALNIAYYSYLPSVMGVSALLNSSEEDRQFTEQILSSNIDKIIIAYNNGNYDSNIYEEVVGCYRMLGIVLLKPEIQADLKMSKDQYDEIIAKTSRNIRRVFDAM